MKDSYSFDIDDAGLKAAYHAHREAYQRIFARLDVRYVIAPAGLAVRTVQVVPVARAAPTVIVAATAVRRRPMIHLRLTAVAPARRPPNHDGARTSAIAETTNDDLSGRCRAPPWRTCCACSDRQKWGYVNEQYVSCADRRR